MAQELIPQDWLRAVCAVLATEDETRIRRTKDFSTRFRRSFPGVKESEVEDALLNHLSQQNVTGCHVQMDYPIGTTWELFFSFRGKKTYGKLMLRIGGWDVLLYSAHLPEKPRLRCE